MFYSIDEQLLDGPTLDHKPSFWESFHYDYIRGNEVVIFCFIAILAVLLLYHKQLSQKIHTKVKKAAIALLGITLSSLITLLIIMKSVEYLSGFLKLSYGNIVFISTIAAIGWVLLFGIILHFFDEVYK